MGRRGAGRGLRQQRLRSLRGLQIDLRPRTSPNPDPNGEAVFLEFNGDDGTFLGGNFDLLGSGLTLEAKGTHDFVFNDD